MKFEPGNVQVHKRTRLPHWHTAHGIYFVTFNLFDAIPNHVRIRIREEAEAQLRLIRSPTIAEKQAIKHWIQSKLGETLDEHHGSCFMRDPHVATIVANAITHFDTVRYELLVWSVMPTHVHVVLTLTTGEHIDRVIHSWKSYTSKEANKLLDRAGPFWQEEYFDRTIRDARELQNTIEYVLNNPAKAGLLDWPFVRLYAERVPG